MKQRIGNTAQFYTLNLGSTTTSAANVEELHNRMTKKFTKSRFEFVNILEL
jgi:hypothetical protein